MENIKQALKSVMNFREKAQQPRRFVRSTCRRNFGKGQNIQPVDYCGELQQAELEQILTCFLIVYHTTGVPRYLRWLHS